MAATWLRSVTDNCKDDAYVEQIRKIVDDAQGYIAKALRAGELVQADSRIFQKLNAANDRLGKIMGVVNRGMDICKDVRALQDIRDALRALGPDTVIHNPKLAAVAFGVLFTSFGRLCRHLPPPGDEWARFLEETGSFFSDMERLLNPVTRPAYLRWCEINRGGAAESACPSRPPD